MNGKKAKRLRRDASLFFLPDRPHCAYNKRKSFRKVLPDGTPVTKLRPIRLHIECPRFIIKTIKRQANEC